MKRFEGHVCISVTPTNIETHFFFFRSSGSKEENEVPTQWCWKPERSPIRESEDVRERARDNHEKSGNLEYHHGKTSKPGSRHGACTHAQESTHETVCGAALLAVLPRHELQRQKQLRTGFHNRLQQP